MLAATLALAGGAGAADEATAGALSSRLAQIAADPSLAALPPAELNEALGLAPHGAGSLMRDGDAIVVEARDHRQTMSRAQRGSSAPPGRAASRQARATTRSPPRSARGELADGRRRPRRRVA